jgi:hypothetical protein
MLTNEKIEKSKINKHKHTYTHIHILQFHGTEQEGCVWQIIGSMVFFSSFAK